MNSLLNRLQLWKKFAVLTLFGVILVAAPFILYLNESGKVINTTGQEIQGLAPMRLLLKTLQKAQEHRGMSAMILSGNAAAEPKRAAKMAEADLAFAALGAELQKNISPPALARVWLETTNA